MEYNNYIETNTKRVKTQYFIDTYGKVQMYDGELNERITSIHYRIAVNLFPEIKDPDDYIMKIGWVMVGSTVYNTPICKKIPTQSQINKLDQLGLLKDLCVSYGEYYYNYLNNIEKF